MIARLAADTIVLIHFGFILFVVLGGLLVFKYRRIAWLHIPAVVWGAGVEFTGIVCPLTPIENTLRRLGGEGGYSGGFVGRYVMPIVYPGGLTRSIQIMLGCLVLAINVAAYITFFISHKRVKRQDKTPLL
ncbi:MAG: DUF2784 domain-containing protein [Desulfobacteraceae bacterium]|nr:DUF2784 domain-containing protein [Desulfobacteraceae bacterium]